jgi:hypothetical protein
MLNQIKASGNSVTHPGRPSSPRSAHHPWHTQGFDKEYDRVLDENKQLQRRLAQVDAEHAGAGTGYRQVNKKDE